MSSTQLLSRASPMKRHLKSKLPPRHSPPLVPAQVGQMCVSGLWLFELAPGLTQNVSSAHIWVRSQKGTLQPCGSDQSMKAAPAIAG